MIQTQLLRLDPPYQIICANGHVGIQVATLIVTKEEDPHNSRLGRITNFITYHSYPVVNYGLKQGVDELMKYNNNPLDNETDYEIYRRLRPEGAVWSGVEVKDVRVLGLAGAKNDSIDLGLFMYLIPSARGFAPGSCVWDDLSISRIYETYSGLGNVGLKTSTLPMPYNTDNKFPIQLILDEVPSSSPNTVKVLIREEPYGGANRPDEGEICFRSLIDPFNSESVTSCAKNIAEALNGLSKFLPTRNILFSYSPNNEQYYKKETDAMEQLTSLVEENYKNLLY